MKKNKHKAIVKESRKAAKQEIKNNIIEALKKIATAFGQPSKKMSKVIEKGAIQLAKKLSKELNLTETTASGEQEIAIQPKENAAKPIKKAGAKQSSKKKASIEEIVSE